MMQPRPWVFPILYGVAAMLAAAAGPLRGLSFAANGQIDAASRAAQWMRDGGEQLLGAAFADERIFPLPGLIAALLAGDGDVLSGLRWFAAVCVGLLVWSVSDAARRAGGSVAALGAALGVLLTPRLLAAATDVAPTVYAVGTTTAMMVSLPRVREHGAWFAVAAPLCAMALLTSLFAWWMLPLAAALLFWSEQGHGRAGQVRVAPSSPAMLLVLPAALALVVAAHPWLHTDVAQRLGLLLERLLRQPPEPWLYAGELYGPRRIPWTAPLVVLGVTTPLALLMPAAASALWAGDPRRVDGPWLRLAVMALVWSLVGVWVLRSPYHGGIDLVAYAAPWLVVLAGVGAGALFVAGPMGGWRMRLLGAAIVLALAGAGWAETSASRSSPRSFYNALVGRLPGAVDRGFPRYAHPAFPVSLFDGLQGRGDDAPRVAIVANAWELAPVLGRFSELGWITPALVVAPVEEADWVVVSLDDTLPERYPIALDLALALATPDGRARVLRVDGLPVAAVLPAR